MQCSMQDRGVGWPPNMTRVMFSFGGPWESSPNLYSMTGYFWLQLGGGGGGKGGGGRLCNNRLASLFNNDLSLYSGRRKINILILLKLWELEGEAVLIYRQWKQRCLLNSTNLPKKVLHCGVGFTYDLYSASHCKDVLKPEFQSQKFCRLSL
jgi:hypothetical protein